LGGATAEPATSFYVKLAVREKIIIKDKDGVSYQKFISIYYKYFLIIFSKIVKSQFFQKY